MSSSEFSTPGAIAFYVFLRVQYPWCHCFLCLPTSSVSLVSLLFMSSYEFSIPGVIAFYVFLRVQYPWCHCFLCLPTSSVSLVSLLFMSSYEFSIPGVIAFYVFLRVQYPWCHCFLCLPAAVSAIHRSYNRPLPADLTVSKRPGTSYQIEIHFAVFIHSHLLFSFMKLVETLQSCSVKKIISPPEIWNRSKLYLMRNLLIWLEKWISI